MFYLLFWENLIRTQNPHCTILILYRVQCISGNLTQSKRYFYTCSCEKLSFCLILFVERMTLMQSEQRAAIKHLIMHWILRIINLTVRNLLAFLIFIELKLMFQMHWASECIPSFVLSKRWGIVYCKPMEVISWLPHNRPSSSVWY